MYVSLFQRVVGDSGMRKGDEECTYIQTLHLVSQDRPVWLARLISSLD